MRISSHFGEVIFLIYWTLYLHSTSPIFNMIRSFFVLFLCCASVFFWNIYSIISGGKKNQQLISRHRFHTRNKITFSIQFSDHFAVVFSSVVYFGRAGNLNSSSFSCFYRWNKTLNVDEEKKFKQVIGLQLIMQWNTFVPFPTHTNTRTFGVRRRNTQSQTISYTKLKKRRKPR